MAPIDLGAEHIDQMKRIETGLQCPDWGGDLLRLADQAQTVPVHVLNYNLKECQLKKSPETLQ